MNEPVEKTITSCFGCRFGDMNTDVPLDTTKDRCKMLDDYLDNLEGCPYSEITIKGNGFDKRQDFDIRLTINNRKLDRG